MSVKVFMRSAFPVVFSKLMFRINVDLEPSRALFAIAQQRHAAMPVAHKSQACRKTVQIYIARPASQQDQSRSCISNKNVNVFCIS